MVGGNCYSPDNLRNDHVDAFLKCRVGEATFVSCGLRCLRRAQVQYFHRRHDCLIRLMYDGLAVTNLCQNSAETDRKDGMQWNQQKALSYRYHN